MVETDIVKTTIIGARMAISVIAPRIHNNLGALDKTPSPLRD
jgi:hypothetical protein